MDFKRIQWVLLAIFLAFDIFLITELTDRVRMQTSSQALTTVVNIETVLEDRNVKVQADLSDERHHLPMVKVAPHWLSSEALESLDLSAGQMEEGVFYGTLPEPLDLPVAIDSATESLTPEEGEAIYQALVLDDQWIVGGEDYSSWTYRPSQRMLIYRQTVPEDYPIVDGTAELRLYLNDDYQVTNYSQTVQGDFLILDNIRPLITAREAVTRLDQRMESVIPDNSILQEVTLSYYRSLDLPNLAIYSPAWEIVYLRPDGAVSTSIVDAMRGQIISRSQLP